MPKMAEPRTGLRTPPLCPLTCFHYAKYLGLLSGWGRQYLDFRSPSTVKLHKTEHQTRMKNLDPAHPRWLENVWLRNLTNPNPSR